VFSIYLIHVYYIVYLRCIIDVWVCSRSAHTNAPVARHPKQVRNKEAHLQRRRWWHWRKLRPKCLSIYRKINPEKKPWIFFFGVWTSYVIGFWNSITFWSTHLFWEQWSLDLPYYVVTAYRNIASMGKNVTVIMVAAISQAINYLQQTGYNIGFI
jgi:hypothetical protein